MTGGLCTALELSHHGGGHQNGLGQVLLSQEKIEEAARSFERALSHNPEYVPTIAGLQKHRVRPHGGLYRRVDAGLSWLSC